MTPRYKEWKEIEIETIHKDLLSMGYVPSAADLLEEMIEELLDAAYEMGQQDSYYNED